MSEDLEIPGAKRRRRDSQNYNLTCSSPSSNSPVLSPSHSSSPLGVSDEVSESVSEDLDSPNEKEAGEESWGSPSLKLIPTALAEMKKSAHELIEQLWRLQLHADLPGWRRDNEFLVANHRPVLSSVNDCVASIFKCHSETLNIWTHLLALIFLLAFYGYLNQNNDGPLIPKHELYVLNLHSLMGALCFLFSTSFHVMECHSPFVHEIFCRLDHFGIAGLIWASKVAWIRSSSLDRDERINLALIQGANVISFISVLMQFSGFLSRPSQRTFRTVWFISTACVFVFFPLVDVVQNHGLDEAMEVARIDLFLFSILSILTGCLFYVCHVPERFFPGQCDIFLQGHTLLHIFVNFTIFLQVYGFRQSAINRENWRLAQKSSIWG